MSENSNSKVHALYIVLILGLIGGLIFTNVKLRKSKTDIETVSGERDNKEKLLKDLQVEYDRTSTDLVNAMTENISLDSIIQVKQRELDEKKNYIAQIISQSNGSKSELAKARKMIDELTAERVKFQAQIDSLVAANKQLEYEKIVLTEEKTSLSASLTEEKQIRSQVEADNVAKQAKIDKASILSAVNVKMTGISINKKGNEVEETKSKNVDKIKLCFDLLENKIAPNGEVDIAVRLIGPGGVTISNQALGSGSITKENGEDVQYTYKMRPSYDNVTKKVCSLWDDGGAISAGSYSVEVYQKGILIGQGTMTLK